MRRAEEQRQEEQQEEESMVYQDCWQWPAEVAADHDQMRPSAFCTIAVVAGEMAANYIVFHF